MATEFFEAVAGLETKFLNLLRSTVTGGASPVLTAPFVQNQADAALLSAPPTETVASALLSPPPTVQNISSVLQTARQTTFTAPLSPLLKSVDFARADQGFCLRWVVPGIAAITHDIIGTFHFGQYILSIFGDGTITLYEDTNFVASAGTDPVYKSVFTFRYSSPNQVTAGAHSLIIYPLLGPYGEKYINFATVNLEVTSPLFAGILSVPGGTRGGANEFGASKECFYRWDEPVNGTPDQAGPDHVTVSAAFWLQERYLMRCHWQVSKLGFWASGYVVDQPWDGQFGHPYTDFYIAPVSKSPTGTTLIAHLRDAVTLSETDITYPFLRFDFTSDAEVSGTDTPTLWGYRLSRLPVSIEVAPGEFPVDFTALSISGAAGDPRRETGSISIRDPANLTPRLGVRSEFAAKIDTTFVHPTDGEQSVTLFRGYVTDSFATKMGAGGRVYPSDDWRDYELTLAGMWLRLSETNSRSILSYEFFAIDPSAPANAQGIKPPWKVTDAIAYLISSAGFPPDMIAIPDLSIRLFPGIGAGGSDQIIDQHTNIAAQCLTLARNYLDRHLAFDPNAGNTGQGQWILLSAPPPGTVTPVHHFVEGTTLASGPDIAGNMLLPHSEAAFASDTTFALKPVQSRTVKPEYNHLWCLSVINGAKLDGHIYNYLSYKVPHSTIDPDPNNGHYLGREKLAVIGDPTLWAGAATGDYAKAQQFIDYVITRYFVASCMARERVSFMGRLAFIKDAVTGNYRPLRFYDPVTWKGQAGWFVRTVSIAYTSDRVQLVKYEIERILPYLAGTGL